MAKRGEIIGDTACPGCRAKGGDKTGNHLILFDNGKNYCNRCQKSFVLNGSEAISTERVRQKPKYSFPSNAELDKLKSDVLTDRHIKKAVVEYFGTKVEYDPETREITKHYYPYFRDGILYAYKVRRVKGKKFATTKPFKDEPVEFFGQHLAGGAKRLLIVAGEIDTMSAHQMFMESGTNYPPDVVGFPQGENAKPFRDNAKWLKKYKEIIVCPDTDDAGQRAMATIARLMGKRVKVMHISLKDSNDMLKAGKQDEFTKAFWDADYWKPAGVISILDLKREDVCKRIEWGLSYPWVGLTNITFGAYTQKVIAVGAGPGAGKTTFFEQIQKHFIFHHKEMIGLYALEGGTNMAVRKLVGAIMNKRIHLPNTEYDEEEAWRIMQGLDPYVKLCKYGENNDIDDVFENMRWLRDEGVKWFFVDPTSALHAGMDASEANKFLEDVCYKWEQFTEEFDCTIFHANHLTNPKTGKDHSSGGKVLPSHFAGSRAQWKFCTDAWGLGRDQLAEADEDKNIVTFGSLKSRMSGNTKEFKMVYEHDTGNLVEVFDDDLEPEFKGDF